MIRTLTLLGLFAFPTAIFSCNKKWVEDLYYRFDIIPFKDIFQLPRTIADATDNTYVPVEGPTESSGFGALTLYVDKSQDCLLIGLLFDECNSVAGLQINIPQDRLSTYYNVTEQGFKNWNYNDVEYLYLRVYFVSEDVNTRSESCDDTKVIRSENVTVTGVNSQLIKFSTNITILDDIWTEQECVPMMGQHYYYNMTSTTTCDKPFQTVFPLFDKKACQFIGLGLMWMGNTTCDCEKPSKSEVEMMVPYGPQCLYDHVGNHGVSTLHIYFVDYPRFITC